MQDNIKNQETLKPTRKMAAVGISGALTTFLIAVVNIYFPGVGELMSAPIEAAVVAGIAFVSGYMTKEEK